VAPLATHRPPPRREGRSQVKGLGCAGVRPIRLDHDEEVAMVVIDQASVDLLDHQFVEDLRHSRQIDLSRWQTRSATQRTLETAVTAIRRWL